MMNQNFYHFYHSTALNGELLHAMLREIAPLLSESDLHIAQLTLHLLTSVARTQQAALLAGGVGDVFSVILNEVFTLLRSPLLQGVALQSLLEFLQALVELNASGKFCFTNVNNLSESLVDSYHLYG